MYLDVLLRVFFTQSGWVGTYVTFGTTSNMCSCLFLPTLGLSQHHDVTLATRTGSIGTMRGRIFLLPIQKRNDILDHICDCSYRPVSGNSLYPLFCHLIPKYLFYLFLHSIHIFHFVFASQSFHHYPPFGCYTSVASSGQLQMSIYLCALQFKTVSSFCQIYSQRFGWCILYFASNIYLFVCFILRRVFSPQLLYSQRFDCYILWFTSGICHIIYFAIQTNILICIFYTHSVSASVSSVLHQISILLYAIQTNILILVVILSILWLVYSSIYFWCLSYYMFCYSNHHLHLGCYTHKFSAVVYSDLGHVFLMLYPSLYRPASSSSILSLKR